MRQAWIKGLDAPATSMIVADLAGDPAQEIVVGTRKGGVQVFDLSGKEVACFRAADRNPITALCADAERNLWAGTQAGMVYVLKVEE